MTKPFIYIEDLEDILETFKDNLSAKNIPKLINFLLVNKGHPKKYAFCSDCSVPMLASAKRDLCSSCKPIDPTEDTKGLFVEHDVKEASWCVKWKDTGYARLIRAGFPDETAANKYLGEILTRGRTTPQRR